MPRAVSFLTALALLVVLPLRAGAHPHEFVDTSLTFEMDAEGRLAAVHVVWHWDELMSLLTLEDLGLDPDHDGALSAGERATLAQRFSDWPEDFAGDMQLQHAGQVVALRRPHGMDVDLREGRFVLDFRRALADPIPMAGASVRLQAFDPTYFVYYDVPELPGVIGPTACDVTRITADLGAARSLYERLVGDLTEEQLMEPGQEPLVGSAFADTFVLTCPG